MRQRDCLDRWSLTLDMPSVKRNVLPATALAVATLALGIGASMTMFHLLNTFFFTASLPASRAAVSVSGLDSSRNAIS
jgi:hypothetical protein